MLRDLSIRLYVRMMSVLRREEGQDLAEYALLIALIAIVVILAVTALGQKIQKIFQDIAAAI